MKDNLTTVHQNPFLDLPFLLVSGQARSGTTVLTKAVGSHPDVFSNMKESNYVVDLVWTVMRACKMETRRRELVVTETELQGNFRNALYNTLFPTELWEKAQHDANGNQPNKRLPAAVSTFSACRKEVASFLIEFLPNVQIVNIVRNGLEVVASRMVHEHIGKRTFREHCVAWADAMDMVQWGHDRPEFSLIRHEHFLDPQKTKKTFDTLFRKLNLPADHSAVDFVCGGLINTTRSADDTDQTATDLATRKQRWRSWSDAQRETFSEICRPAMIALGYEMPW